MTKDELRQRLIDENIQKDSYSLDDGLPNEAFCFAKNGNVWEVYYSERGGKTGLKSFKTEEEACDFFYHSLITTLTHMGLLK